MPWVAQVKTLMNAAAPDVGDGVEPIRPGMRRQREVAMRASVQVCALASEILAVADRSGMGVLDHRGDAPRDRGARPGREVLAGIVARVHEMDVGIDEAGHHEAAAGIQCRLRVGPGGCA